MPDAVVRVHSTRRSRGRDARGEPHRVPVTPRAGGTGRTGGAVPVAGGIVLAFERMNRIMGIERDDLDRRGRAGRDHRRAPRRRRGATGCSIRPIRTRSRPARSAATSPRTPAGRARCKLRRHARLGARHRRVVTAAGDVLAARQAHGQGRDRLRPHVADGRQRRHARRDHRDHAASSSPSRARHRHAARAPAATCRRAGRAVSAVLAARAVAALHRAARRAHARRSCAPRPDCRIDRRGARAAADRARRRRARARARSSSALRQRADRRPARSTCWSRATAASASGCGPRAASCRARCARSRSTSWPRTWSCRAAGSPS